MRKYEAVPFVSLKESTQKAVVRFLDALYKVHKVEATRDQTGRYVNPLPEHALTLELTNLSSVAQTTLGTLANTKAAEVFEQLPTNEVKVESLVGSFCKTRLVIAPIVLGVIKATGHEGAIVIAGRHRLTALLTLFQLVPNAQDLHVGVYIDDRYKNQAELITAVEQYNVSRAVTSTEKAQYRLTSKGLTADQSFASIFSGLLEDTFKAADMGAIFRVAARNWFDERELVIPVDAVGTPASGAALGNYGNGTLSAFSHTAKKPNPLVQAGTVTADQLKELKKTLTAPVQVQGGTAPLAQVFLEQCLVTLQSNWPSFFEQLKAAPTDASVNFARASASVGYTVGVKVLESLLPVALQATEVAAATAAEKKAASKRKSAASQLRSFYAAYQHLTAVASSMPAESLQQALAQMAQNASADLGISAEDFFAAMQNGGTLPEVEATQSSLPTSTPPVAPAPAGGQGFML